MVPLPRDAWYTTPSSGESRVPRWRHRLGYGTGWILLALLACPVHVMADPPVNHLRRTVDAPPGAIGRQQLLRGGPLRGYSQPVEIRAPQGALISPVYEGSFAQPYAAPARFGIQLGYAYRFRISEIPNQPGIVLYPSVELVDRTYPPDGKKWDYPVPIEITAAELRMAASGKLITRVVYIEDPDSALPVAERPGSDQRYFEAYPGEDPLEVADSLGRPVAILRLGARGPDRGGLTEAFTFGSPPLEMPAAGTTWPAPGTPPPNFDGAAARRRLPQPAPVVPSSTGRPDGTTDRSRGIYLEIR